MSGEHSVAVQTMPPLELPPPLVTIDDRDLLNPVTGHLIVKPLEEMALGIQEKIGVVPSTLPSSIPTGASIPVLELKAKWEIPPPPDCAPPPPPFSNSSSGPSSWDPPVAPHDLSQEASDGIMTVHPIELPLPLPPSILRCPDVPSTEGCSQTEAFTSPGQTVAASTGHGPPSEADSDDADLLRKMVHSRSLLVGGDEGLGDEDDVLIDDYEDEDDASFTVHFAHHGRKEPDLVPAKVDLLAQISELQEAVASMKGSLTEAVARLGAVAAEEPPLALPPPDPAPMYAALQEKCDANTAQVLKLVLALKNDVTGLKKDVSAITERQDLLQRTVEGLLEDRRTDTLGRSSGGGGDGTGGGGPRSSGGHSNDSGVALLLERAHQAFHGDRMSSSPATSTLHRGDDQDSLPDRPSLLVPPLVYDYVAGLSSGQLMHSSLGTGDQDDLAYDSDSSLTLAANKSISLSATISKEMRANMAAGGHPYGGGHDGGHGNSGHLYGGQEVGHGKAVRGHIVTKSKGHSKCSTSNHSSTDSGSGPAINRTDSDGSDQSRDVVQTTRRRRYEKGSSSSTSKLYGPLCRSLSQDCATYQALSTYSAGQGLYSHTSHHHPHRDSRDIHRCRVARELLETEKEYCRTLWIIQDTFANPLQKSCILSKKDINTLFPTEVYQLYDKHCHLQHQLRERLASWEWQPLVGDILAKFTDSQHSDVLRLYTSYVNDFPEVLKTFHKLCRSSPPFTKFIKSCLEQPSCGGLDLGAFLLTPVQRIPRYILLLKQLLKYTDETHPDFHHVNVCLDRLKNFLERLNDSIEHSFQLVHASFSPGGLLGQPLPVATRQTHGRVSRSPRRTRSTVETSPTYSPERPTSRSTDRCSPGQRGGESSACSGTSRGVASPKRSISLAGGPAKTLAVSKRRQQSTDGGRSRSLPRAVPLSPVHSQDSSPESGGRPARPLPSARSVADMTQATGHDDEDSETREGHAGEAGSSLWEELAASEPSLLEAQGKKQIEGACHEGGPNGKLSSAQSASNLAQDGGRLRPWHDPATQLEGNPALDDGTAKKKSIKTSLKNMFTFKKRNAASPSSGNRSTQPTPPHHHHFHHPHDHHHHHHHSHPAHHHPTRPSTARGMREESDYWDPQAAQIQDSSAQTSGGQTSETSHPPAQSQSNSQSQQGQAHSQQQQSSSQKNSQQTVTSQAALHSQNSGSHSQNGLYQSLSSLQHPQTPLHIPHPPSTPVPGQSQPGLSVVGDFVDEDGNPCSNV